MTVPPVTTTLQVFRLWNPQTHEVYATPGDSSREIAERTVRDARPRPRSRAACIRRETR